MIGKGLNKLLCLFFLLGFFHNVKSKALTVANKAELCGPFNVKLIETNTMPHANRDVQHDAGENQRPASVRERYCE